MTKLSGNNYIEELVANPRDIHTSIRIARDEKIYARGYEFGFREGNTSGVERAISEIEEFCQSNLNRRAPDQRDSGYAVGMGDVLNKCKMIRAQIADKITKCNTPGANGFQRMTPKDVPPLSGTEILNLRKMIKIYDRECRESKQQCNLEEELASMDTSGDGYGNG